MKLTSGQPVGRIVKCWPGCFLCYPTDLGQRQDKHNFENFAYGINV